MDDNELSAERSLSGRHASAKVCVGSTSGELESSKLATPSRPVVTPDPAPVLPCIDPADSCSGPDVPIFSKSVSCSVGVQTPVVSKPRTCSIGVQTWENDLWRQNTQTLTKVATAYNVNRRWSMRKGEVIAALMPLVEAGGLPRDVIFEDNLKKGTKGDF